MTYSTLIVETGETFVGTITLNRPDQLNTFTTPLAVDLQQALLALYGDLPTEQLVELMAQGFALAELVGMDEVRDGR